MIYIKYPGDSQQMTWSTSGTSSTTTYYKDYTMAYYTDESVKAKKARAIKTPEGVKSPIIKAIGESALFASDVILLLSKDHNFTGGDINSLHNYGIAPHKFVEGSGDDLPNISNYKGAVIINALDECDDDMDRASLVKEYIVGIRRDISSPFMLIISKKLGDDELKYAIRMAGAKSVWKPEQLILKDHSFIAGR